MGTDSYQGTGLQIAAPADTPALPPLGSPIRLPDLPGPLHAQARSYCLTMIREVYGFAYRPDWHADLDSLLRPPRESHYASGNRGAFWLIRDEAGPAASIGIKRLDWQRELAARLSFRYADIARVATLTRAYVRADLRGRGFGSTLTQLCVAAARTMGYDVVYLHTNIDAEDAKRFWRARGWTAFGAFGMSAHFDLCLMSDRYRPEPQRVPTDREGAA